MLWYALRCQNGKRLTITNILSALSYQFSDLASPREGDCEGLEALCAVDAVEQASIDQFRVVCQRLHGVLNSCEMLVECFPCTGREKVMSGVQRPRRAAGKGTKPSSPERSQQRISRYICLPMRLLHGGTPC